MQADVAPDEAEDLATLRVDSDNLRGCREARLTQVAEERVNARRPWAQPTADCITDSDDWVHVAALQWDLRIRIVPDHPRHKQCSSTCRGVWSAMVGCEASCTRICSTLGQPGRRLVRLYWRRVASR